MDLKSEEFIPQKKSATELGFRFLSFNTNLYKQEIYLVELEQHRENINSLECDRRKRRKWEILTEADHEETADSAKKVDSDETLDHEKCTKQHAQNVGRNAKFHSSQLKADQYFVKSAIRKRNHSTKILSHFIFYFFIFFFIRVILHKSL